MIPIRDHNPSTRTPYVTWALIAVNILVFLTYWQLFDSPRMLASFFNDWALIPAKLAKWPNSYALVTSMFLHGGLLHLAGNMLFLWIYGDNLEDTLGHFWFLAFYLAGGVAAGAVQVLADPLSTTPMVGASGAIAAVMGGYLVLFPKARIDILFFIVIYFRIFTIPAWIVLGVWFGIQVVSGVGADADADGIAYWAHAGGFVAGLILILPAFLRRGAGRYWQETQGRPPHPETRYSRTNIPVVRRRK